jgi:NAD(P)-dependent dehydrogenase (short-subunit alcohol dehydrogenase family)
MVTGANSGIGKATSAALARMGSHVTMVCRDPARGEEARAEVIRTAGVTKDGVSLMLADLASFASVRKLAADFLQTDQPLHVLDNNAGLILGKRSMTVDGFETTFEVNYLSHFLLTDLLLYKLKASAPSRIINVSSSAHLREHVDFSDLQGEKGYTGLKSYSQSKLAQVLFTLELAKRLEGTGVTVNCLHPGVVATNWARRSAGALSVGVRLGSMFMLSPEKGADTAVYLASSPEVAHISGKYFYKRAVTESSKESMDEEVAKKLWDVSVQLTSASR